MKPTVLVATTRRWFSTARLASALADAGFVVDVACPQHHPVEKTSSVRQMHRYRTLRPLKSFTQAIAQAKPDLIVPSDELAVRHLHDLHRCETQRYGHLSELAKTIANSLGDPAIFSSLHSRTTLIDIARGEGIRVPKTAVIHDIADLRNWTASSGFPTVLKADGSSGGIGVRVVRSYQEAKQAFHDLKTAPSFTKALKQLRVDRDGTLILPALVRRQTVVNAQAFTSGREATSTIACWKGTVVAALHFEVLKSAYPGGPSTVVRWIDNDEMVTAATKIARRLNLSGIHGLDFILEQDAENASLIELNPRATQVGHLPMGRGRDIPAALLAGVTGYEEKLRTKITENAMIALFPQEWIRDSSSEFLRSAYNDVPWNEPDLVRACVAAHRPKNGADLSPDDLAAFFAARRKT